MDKHMVYIMYLKHARSKRKEKQGGRPLDARMVSVAQLSWEREKPAVRCGGSGFKQEAPVIRWEPSANLCCGKAHG